MAKKADAGSTVIEIAALSVDAISAYIVGDSPIILNRMAEKAKHELLLGGGGRKTMAGRAVDLKHNPPEEYRAAPYRLRDNDAETLLAFPAGGIKKALCNAALCIPGARKAEIGRLTNVHGDPARRDLLPVYGIPQLFMRVVRNSDINRTPDIRTRVIIEKWAIPIEVRYVKSLITPTAVANLLAAAGLTIGIGDWRQEKGAGSYGQFSVRNANDPELQEIIQSGGREVQIQGMENPTLYDDETIDLMDWFHTEVKRRGVAAAA